MRILSAYHWHLFLISCIALITISCNSGNSGSKETATKQELLRSGFSDKGIDRATIETLLREADVIEYIFNDFPGSMNQSGKEVVQYDLGLISTEAIKEIPKECKPLARKIYMGKGNILLEADLYFSNPCFFQIFIKDEKALFGNGITEQAYTIYRDLIDQVNKAAQGQ